MADLIVFPVAVEAMARGEIDLESDTLKGVLVSTLSTVPDEPNAETVADFTTLDEYAGASYGRTALTGVSVDTNTSAQRVQVSANDLSFGAIGASGRAANGLLVVKHVNGGAADIPIAFLRFIANVNGDGSTAFSVVFPSGRLIHNSYPS